MSMRLVVSTRNRHKLDEIRRILSDLDFEILSLDDHPDAPEVIEDEPTFEANALKKAMTISQHIGLPTIADDSGLVVDALNGKPGVMSARFAGDDATDLDRNNKLLSLMKAVPDEDRTARFVCVIALALPDGRHFLFRGECEGLITREVRGENGFGYDPVFFVPSHQLTFGEMRPEIKNSISHRGRALRKLKDFLAENRL